MRELTMNELEFVSGGATAEGLAGAAVAGAVTGALASAATGGTVAPITVIGGALLGAIAYLVNDIITN